MCVYTHRSHPNLLEMSGSDLAALRGYITSGMSPRSDAGEEDQDDIIALDEDDKQNKQETKVRV